MTTYRIVRGTLSVGTAGTWGIESGGVMFDYPASGWRAYLNSSDIPKISAPCDTCSLTVDLEGGGELRGVCSVVEVGVGEAQVESNCQPEEFVEPTILEAD